VQPCEQTVKRDKSGLKREDAIKPCQQGGLASLGRTAAIGLDSAIELQVAALGHAVFVGEGAELVNEALGMALIRRMPSPRKCRVMLLGP
jgi:hypothetical protein